MPGLRAATCSGEKPRACERAGAIALREDVGLAAASAFMVSTPAGRQEVDPGAALAVAGVHQQLGLVGQVRRRHMQHVGAVLRQHAAAGWTRQHAREIEARARQTADDRPSARAAPAPRRSSRCRSAAAWKSPRRADGRSILRGCASGRRRSRPAAIASSIASPSHLATASASASRVSSFGAGDAQRARRGDADGWCG